MEEAAKRAAAKNAIQALGEPEGEPEVKAEKPVAKMDKEEILENVGSLTKPQLIEVARKHKIGLKGNESADAIRAKVSAYLG